MFSIHSNVNNVGRKDHGVSQAQVPGELLSSAVRDMTWHNQPRFWGYLCHCFL